ncbi:unnamed protein product [Sphagnum jensenii]|jgi:hypothetical protein|uniref:Uncharacterized protein n=1 Tax=Sphagnum jensenii TaxID=128206 RepID=A0ABP0XHM1_9BRYO
MAPPQRTARINLQEFKSKFLKLLGPAKESQYCGLLSSFLSYRLTKGELDRLVPLTIGKENLVLHNQFVRAIFTNAYCAEAPVLPSPVYDISKPVKGIRRKPVTPSEGSPTPPSPGVQGIRSNGDGFVISPHQGRPGFRDRKATERPSPLGNHRAEASTSQGTPSEDEAPRALENGNLASPDLLRPLQQSNSAFEVLNLDNSPSVPPLKRPRYGDHHSNNADVKSEVTGSEMEQEEEVEEDEDAEDVEDEDDDDDEQEVLWMNSYLQPPLGISFCIPSSASWAAGVSMLPGRITHTLLGDALDVDCLTASDLPDTETMQRRIQQGAVVENGLQGVSAECANVVNLALDLYLKALIKPTIELVQSKRAGNREKMASCKENGGAGYLEKERKREASFLPQQNLVHGLWLKDSTGVSADATSEGGEKGFSGITPLDFYVAMDLHHQILGENFPIHLERILLRIMS